MKRKNKLNKKSPPWYRVGMVWLMLGLPLSAVLASMLTLTIAYENAPTITAKQHSRFK